MSHEIRTPMNGILGTLNLIEDQALGQQEQHYKNLALKSAKSLLVIIDDILDFSKIEAGKLEIDHTTFHLRELIKDTCAIFLAKAQEKNIKLNVKVSDIEVDHVIGDPVRIRQIINNLVSNAVKFTDQGEILVNAKLYDNKDEWRFEFSVLDTGIGIPKDKLNTLFHCFSQVDASTTRKYGGTGLGLAIAEQLCELMQGHITVKSKEQEGSCFTVTIPLEKVSKDTVNKTQDTTHKDNIEQSMPIAVNNKQKHILIVEDNLINQEVALAIIEGLGYSADIAENGLEALEKLKQTDTTPYGLIFMDCQMPEMDGYETTKNIRKGNADNHLANSKLPIIAMTANAMKGDKEKCISVGMDDYISKPVDPNKIQEKLNQWL